MMHNDLQIILDKTDLVFEMSHLVIYQYVNNAK